MTGETQTPEQVASDDAAFTAGFQEQRGEEPALTAKPAESTASTQVASPATDKVSDAAPAAEVPPWKAEIDATREDMGKQIRALNGHIGNLTAQTKNLGAALAQAKAATEARGAEAPTKEQVEKAAESDARWKQLKEDFPDWADAVDERLAKLQAALPAAAPPVDVAAIQAAITPDMQKRIDEAAKAAEKRSRVYSRLDEMDEDWETKIASPEFEAWYATQPKEVQALSASDRGSDAKKMLALFIGHQKKAAEKGERAKRLDNAIAPSGVAVTAAHEDEDAAFSAGFNEVRAS